MAGPTEESAPAGWPRTDAGEGDLSRDGLERWGRALGRAAREDAAWVALSGPLGVGKTTVVQAACRGAGCTHEARSPTYLLHRPLPLTDGRSLHHLDLYRVTGRDELDDLGWDDLMGSGEPVFVEWAERAGDRLPRDRWEVRLGFMASPGLRHVSARRRGELPALPDPGAAGSSESG